MTHDTEQTQPADEVPLEPTVVPLVACPLCGGQSGYTVTDGSSCRWWAVLCKECGEQVCECRAGKMLWATVVSEPHVDAAWNEAGAYADRMRRAIELACAGYPDDAAAPTCVAVLRDALRHKV